MIHKVQLCSLGLLLAGSGLLPCAAQTASVPAPGRFYVGASFIRKEYLVYSDARRYTQQARPWEAVAGVQVTPNWALQVGFANRVSRSSPTPGYYGEDGQLIGDVQTTYRITALPVLVRYTALRERHTGLQLDVVGGGTVAFSSIEEHYLGFVGGPPVVEQTFTERTTQKYVTAGLGVRYPLGRHVEGVLDWAYSRNLASMPTEQRKGFTGNKYGLTRAVGLGLTYRFHGFKKPAAS
ncbi:outer membrane beta-barrel protein [Hymenobacter sp. BT683]|uniref:Outer membrane beta-barrel protein n=1 Tax=Hymenobacter jeongseonensis TaxID=2791027 RepID=A0ABS0IGX0_9BACT|nr:outer membrane beta-barrel protein [Hymenobacter jeongseonensis]MBF9237601.1 outer membrane beta-barrel protein [Hymenobacter jeongseonensis]